MASRLISIPGQKHSAGPETVEERIAKLELRLADGFSRIGEAMEHGINVDHWERHWIELLREYELLHSEFTQAA